jgi:hypothetical protein
MADKPRSLRNLLSFGIIILVALSLVFAAVQLLRGAGGATGSVLPPLNLTPEPGEETPDPTQPEDPELDISADDLRELSLAVAAVITALTGLLGLVASQIWRTRDETRLDQKHVVSLERERLALEKERLALEKERLEVERQRQALRDKEARRDP